MLLVDHAVESTTARGHSTSTSRSRPPVSLVVVRLLLIRHGQTPSERARGAEHGRSPAPGSPSWGRQAAALPSVLAVEQIAAIYVSQLTRTHRTAAPLAAARGLEPIELLRHPRDPGGRPRRSLRLAVGEGVPRHDARVGHRRESGTADAGRRDRARSSWPDSTRASPRCRRSVRMKPWRCSVTAPRCALVDAGAHPQHRRRLHRARRPRQYRASSVLERRHPRGRRSRLRARRVARAPRRRPRRRDRRRCHGRPGRRSSSPSRIERLAAVCE